MLLVVVPATVLGLLVVVALFRRRRSHIAFAHRVPFRIISSTKENSQLPKVLVTGGLGFVGGYVVNELLEKGTHQIRVFDRQAPKTPNPRVEYIIGDIREYDHIKKSMEGVESVLHMAAMLGFPCPELDSRLQEINVEGTKNVLRACREESGVGGGVKRLVYTSSVGAIVDPNIIHPSEPIHEDVPYPTEILDTYAGTKRECERLVLSSTNPTTLTTCVLRPGAVFGKGDKFLVDPFTKGEFPFIIGDGHAYIPWVWVEDVAKGHVLALNAPIKNVQGRAFNLAGALPHIKYRTFNGLNTGTESLSHWHHPHPRCVPLNVILSLAYVNEFLGMCFDWAPMGPGLTVTGVKYTQRDYPLRIQKAVEELGYEPRGVLEAIGECVARAEGKA